MSDILTAFSVIVALITLFYTEWSKDAERFINEFRLPNKDQVIERDKRIDMGLSFIRSKLYPLLITSLMFSIMVLIEVIKIIVDMIDHISICSSVECFSTVKGMIVFLLVVSVYINYKMIIYISLAKEKIGH